MKVSEVIQKICHKLDFYNYELKRVYDNKEIHDQYLNEFKIELLHGYNEKSLFTFSRKNTRDNKRLISVNIKIKSNIEDNLIAKTDIDIPVNIKNISDILDKEFTDDYVLNLDVIPNIDFSFYMDMYDNKENIIEDGNDRYYKYNVSEYTNDLEVVMEPEDTNNILLK